LTTEPANPRAARTKAALMAAGQRLFSQHPIDAVTVDDIVQAAEVGKGSFYNHFTDREALARAIAGVEDPARRLARAVCTYLRFALDEPEPAGVLVHIHSGHTSLTTPLNRGLVEDIETGLASGRFEVATVESGVLYVLGVTQLALVRIVQEHSPAFAISLSQQMCALVLRGLGVGGAEADKIAAQASDAIVRQNGSRPPAPN
jgi:AcrR family transcriptional regulator